MRVFHEGYWLEIVLTEQIDNPIPPYGIKIRLPGGKNRFSEENLSEEKDI